jgi:hypothetical protein
MQMLPYLLEEPPAGRATPLADKTSLKKLRRPTSPSNAVPLSGSESVNSWLIAANY